MKQFDVMIIGAHPDDAFIGAGGLMLKMQKRGLSVLVVTVTDGENQSGDFKTRSKEFFESVQLCGVQGHQMQYRDGWLQFHAEDLCSDILKLMVEINPKIIITHSSCDQHTDHKTVANAVSSAVELMFHFLKNECRLKYLMAFPPIRLGIDSLQSFTPMLLCDVTDYCKIKESAVLVHSSQMPYLELNLKKHIALNRFYGTLISSEYAEGYSYKHFENDVSIENILRAL